jgi:hypothetical protein
METKITGLNVMFREGFLTKWHVIPKVDKDDIEIPVFNRNKPDTLYKNGPDASCHSHLL